MTGFDSAPMLNCDGCRTTMGRAGCATHGGGVWAAESVAHLHRWVFDGALAGGMLVYHCNDHDPPLVRQVWPGTP